MDQSIQPRRHSAPGTPPGTLVAAPGAIPSTLQLFLYDANGIQEKANATLDDVRAALAAPGILWVNVNGLGSLSILEGLQTVFGLHPLAMEDALNTYQRPKVDVFEKYDFIVVRMSNRVDKADMEQLSLFLGDRFVLTLQERPGDCFDSIRDRLRKDSGRSRKCGADYLAYALLDAVVDFYFPTLENYGERLDNLEERALAASTRAVLSDVHRVRRDLLTFRRSVWPLRDAFSAWLRDPSPRLTPETRLYLRDLYDHSVQLMDLIETYRELCSDLMDIYLSGVNLRMNEIMKVLTVISTIFIPMTFIASIYGMNFQDMPELHWRWGYPAVLCGMALIAVGMIVYFRKKRWF
jgi:magnesium transporter